MRDGASPREQRRRQQEELARLHLLDAAEIVFSQKGFSGSSVKEIAERAEFSVGAVYQFFEGKAELFRGVMRRRNDEVTELMRSAMAGVDTPTEQLHALIDQMVDWFTRHEDFYRLFQRAIGTSWLNLKAGFDDANFQQYEDILAIEAELFTRGIEAGEFLDLDPEGMAVLFAGMTQAYLAHAVVGVGVHVQVAAEKFPPTELHHLVDRAFVRPERASRPRERRSRSGSVS